MKDVLTLLKFIKEGQAWPLYRLWLNDNHRGVAALVDTDDLKPDGSESVSFPKEMEGALKSFFSEHHFVTHYSLVCAFTGPGQYFGDRDGRVARSLTQLENTNTKTNRNVMVQRFENNHWQAVEINTIPDTNDNEQVFTLSLDEEQYESWLKIKDCQFADHPGANILASFFGVTYQQARGDVALLPSFK